MEPVKKHLNMKNEYSADYKRRSRELFSCFEVAFIREKRMEIQYSTADMNSEENSLICAFLQQPFLNIPCSLSSCEFCKAKLDECRLSGSGGWELLLTQSKDFRVSCDVAQSVWSATTGSLFFISGFCMKCQVGERRIRKTWDKLSVSPITGPVDIDSFFTTFANSESRPCARHGEDLVGFKCFGDRPQFCVMKACTELKISSSRSVMPLRLELVQGKTKLVVTPCETLFDRCYYVGNPCYRSTWHEESLILATAKIENETHYLVQVISNPVSETLWNLQEVVESLPFHTGLGAYKTLEFLSSGLKLADAILFPPQKDKVRQELVNESYVRSDEKALSTNVDESLNGMSTAVLTETPVKEVVTNTEIDEDGVDVIERIHVPLLRSAVARIPKVGIEAIALEEPNISIDPIPEPTETPVKNVVKNTENDEDGVDVIQRIHVPLLRSAVARIGIVGADAIALEESSDVALAEPNISINPIPEPTETPVKEGVTNTEIDEDGVHVIERIHVPFLRSAVARIPVVGSDAIALEEPNISIDPISEPTETPVKEVAANTEIDEDGVDVIVGQISIDAIPEPIDPVPEHIQPISASGLRQCTTTIETEIADDVYEVESEPTSIPFLYASYPVLLEHGYENSHYSEEAPEETKTFEEMSNIIKAKVDLCITGARSEDVLSMDLRRNTVLGSSFTALNVTCDVDSIDLVTVPWGGMAFQGSRFRLLSMYCTSYAEKKRYLARNNNLSCFHESSVGFPGKFFLSHAITRRVQVQTTQEALHDPLAVTVIHMKSEMCMENMKIRALVPTGSISCALKGPSNLVWLFQSLLGRPHSRGAEVSDRRTCHGLFWFMIREFLFLMLSFISRAATYPNCDPRMACCAIPTKENKKFHDRERGPNSSFAAGLDLECDEMKAAFLLGARFMASLERFARVPSPNRSFRPSDNDMYKCDEKVLLVVEDNDVFKCLESEIDSEACKKFFIDNMWDGRTVFGGLVRLHSDPERKGRESLPGVWSNKRACDSGFMVLEDLLILAPVIFRVTEHGMKHAFETSKKCSLVKNTLEREFSLASVQDGIVDVGFVIEGPKKSGVAVLMPRDTVYSNLLVPTALENRTARQLNAQFHSTCGYPEVLGFSTANGNVGMTESVLVPEKVRRVKCYSSNRRFQATRGSSVYDSTGVPLEMELRNVSKIVCDWMNLKTGVRHTVRLKSEEQERKRKRLFDVILHDINLRMKSVSSSTETFGVRVELTFGCSEDFNFMDEASVLLGLQEQRKRMSVESFCEEFTNNPGKWPWFMRLPSNDDAQVGEESVSGFGSSTMPVTLVKTKSMVDFYATLEEKLVQSARDVYRIACAYVSGNMENMPQPRSQILESFIRASSQGTGSEMAMILCRGLLAGSKILVDSLNCNIPDGIVQMQPFVLSACGVDATYSFGGIPQVIWARILSLDESFERILRFITRTSNEAHQLMELHQDMDGVAAHIDGDMDLPDSLYLSSRKQIQGFKAQVFGSHEDREVESASPGQEGTITRINKIAIATFLTQSEELRNRSMYHLAAFFVLMLIQDCYNELEIMLGRRPSNSLSSEEVSTHENSSNMLAQGHLRTVVSMLAKLSAGNKHWPRCHSIDGFDVAATPSSQGIRHRMNRILSFYNDRVDGVSPLDQDNVIDYRSSLCDEDGAMDVDKFIQTLWERSGMLPQYSELAGQESGSQASKQWKSVIALRIFEGIMECEDERDLLINADARRRGMSDTKELFQAQFASCLEDCLRHAGFFNVCPLIIDCFCGPRGEPNRIWGPMPIFTVLKRRTGNLSQLRRSASDMTHRNERHGLDRRYLIVRKKRLQQLKRDIRDHLYKIGELDNRRPSNGQGTSEWSLEKQSLVRGFWSRSNVNEVFIEYFSMFQDEKSDLGLNKDSKDYCLMVVEFVLKIRREYGDEGLALFAWSERDEDESQIRRLLDVDTSNERDIVSAKKTFQTEVDYFKKPWTVLGYPNPTKTRDGKVTKKVTVRLCARLLFESGIVFKTVTPSRGDRRLPIERYTCLHVGYLYRKCRNAGIESCQSSHSMWRLAPDNILFTLLTNHCNSEIEKLECV